jgi:phenol 2-monooxygenase
MPSPRCLNSVQSTDHGLLLWCPIDNRRTRIGYVFSKEIQDKWALSGEGEGVTREAVETEAKLAVRPFELEFEEMDWFTVYVS